MELVPRDDGTAHQPACDLIFPAPDGVQVCMEEEYTRQQELVEREHNEREDRKFDMLRSECLVPNC